MPILLQADSVVANTVAQTEGLVKPDFWAKVIDYIRIYGIKLIIAILIFIIGKWIAKGISNLMSKMMQKRNMDKTLANFLGNVINAILLIIVIIAAMSALGIKTSSLMVIFGAAVLAIGIAMQGQFANFAAGFMLASLKPFKIGDSVIAGGHTGTVHDIGIMTTTILTGDNKKIIVPNGAIAGGAITNLSAMPTRKIELAVVVPGTTDLNKARDILMGIVRSDSRILADPAPSVSIAETNATETKFGLGAHVKNAEMGAVQSELLEKIRKALNENGIWV
ncbi:MAG: mechanosensitive ion channel [Candidatus Syntrophosphaera sp.]|nr:mechanosensitive ion channel [Candidatus Syntrophosphaera sp.]